MSTNFGAECRIIVSNVDYLVLKCLHVNELSLVVQTFILNSAVIIIDNDYHTTIQHYLLPTHSLRLLLGLVGFPIPSNLFCTSNWLS